MGSKKDELYEEAIDTTSKLIRYHLNAIVSEYYEPFKPPDDGYHLIKTHKEAVTELRVIRDRYENLYFRKDYLEP